jgi:hypothetical protein
LPVGVVRLASGDDGIAEIFLERNIFGTKCSAVGKFNPL